MALKNAINLISNEAIVVYREANSPMMMASSQTARCHPLSAHEAEQELQEPVKQKERRVERRLVRGPTLFIPEANEWLHEFSWHGPIGETGGEKAHHRPNITKFAKLRTLPDQVSGLLWTHLSRRMCVPDSYASLCAPGDEPEQPPAVL